jgi:preprotein translocase subunit SecE
MLRRAPPAPVRPSRSTRSARSFSPTEVGKNLTAGVSHFIYETRTELRKVVWPSREQAINLTGLVIAVALAVSVFIGAVDAVLEKLFQLLAGG